MSARSWLPGGYCCRMGTNLRVGGETVAFGEAKAWATEYLTGRPGTSAYPAYDGNPGADSDSVGPQDLLAVALLNVSNKPLKVYYSLGHQVDLLNSRLQHPELKGSLRDATLTTREAIADLFDVLEDRRLALTEILELMGDYGDIRYMPPRYTPLRDYFGWEATVRLIPRSAN